MIQNKLASIEDRTVNPRARKVVNEIKKRNPDTAGMILQIGWINIGFPLRSCNNKIPARLQLMSMTEMKKITMLEGRKPFMKENND